MENVQKGLRIQKFGKNPEKSPFLGKKSNNFEGKFFLKIKHYAIIFAFTRALRSSPFQNQGDKRTQIGMTYQHLDWHTGIEGRCSSW